MRSITSLKCRAILTIIIEKREKAYDGGYTVGAKRDAQPEKAANIFYAVGPEKREAEKALDGEYTVGVKRDAQPEEATNIFYAVE